MNPYVVFFFLPLAWFVTSFIIEAGSLVMVPLCKYEKYREKMTLTLGALWAIIATSLVFLVVTLDTVFAPVLFVTGEVLYAPLLVLIIVLALHHFLIGSAEGSSSLGLRSNERKYLTLAVPFALLVAFLGNTIFTSVFSGYGFNAVDLLKLEIYPNYSSMFLNAFNWLFFLGVVFYVVYFTVTFYGIKERFKVGLVALTLAHTLILTSTALWLPTVFMSAVGNPWFYIFLALTYLVLYVGTHRDIPMRQAWIFLLTFLGVVMFGLFSQGRILVDIVPKGVLGQLPGAPASILLTNSAMLQAGSLVLGIAGFLVMGGLTAVSYKVLYKQGTKEERKIKT